MERIAHFSFYHKITNLLSGESDLATRGDLAQFPHEVIIEIFARLDVRCMGKIARLNHSFYILSQDKWVWKQVFFFHFPMASKQSNIYENIGYKQLLVEDGWDRLLASPKISVPIQEKILIACYRVSDDWTRNNFDNYTAESYLFNFSAYLFKKVYANTITLKAESTIKQFQESLYNYQLVIDQLATSFKEEDLQERRTAAEALMVNLLQRNISVLSRQLLNNPRWTIDPTAKTFDIRKFPEILKAAPTVQPIPRLWENKLLSTSERSTTQKKLTELNQTVAEMKTILDAKQISIAKALPWYKRVAHSLLIAIAALCSALGATLLLRALYQLFYGMYVLGKIIIRRSPKITN